jgi:hypothetical protein
LTRKAAEARRAAEEEARRARAEADRLAAEALAREVAAKPSAPAAPVLDRAIEAEARAAVADAIAAAKPADLSRTRGDYGAVASLRTTWEYEVTDFNAVPRQFLVVNDLGIRAHIRTRAKDQPPSPIAGIKFIEKSTAVVR